jgi:ferritin-like metal-binding protein YciE
MKATQNEWRRRAAVDQDPFREFIIAHLNRIYCVQSHMAERLEELLDQQGLSGLRVALEETLGTVEQQLTRLYGIYLLLNGVPAMEGCDELTELMEVACATMYGKFAGEVFQDLAVFFYVQTAESAAMVSYKQLGLIVSQVGHQRLQTLLADLCDGVAANHFMVSAIMEKHWKSF